MLIIKKNSIGTEKRGGILKPQGSLEKAREERNQAIYLSENDNSSCNTSLSNSSQNSIRNDAAKTKRSRQNIAMQTLAKKVDDNNKQVTFHTELSIKTIDKLQPKPHEKPDILPDISEPIRPKDYLPQPVPLPPNYTIPPPNNPHADLPSSHAFQNATNPSHLSFNQNQNYPRLNVGNVPFSMQYPNNTSDMLYHNNIPQCNSPYSRPQIPNTRPPESSLQNNGFNPGFERLNYQNPTLQLMKDPWLVEEKLPMPPPTWWTNNQKPVPFRSYPPCPPEPFNPYNMNVPSSNLSFIDTTKPSSMDFNMQHTTNVSSLGLGNMSVWNSGSNVQSMLMNQPGSSMMQPMNQTKDIGRESNSKVSI